MRPHLLSSDRLYKLINILQKISFREYHIKIVFRNTQFPLSTMQNTQRTFKIQQLTFKINKEKYLYVIWLY